MPARYSQSTTLRNEAQRAPDNALGHGARIDSSPNGALVLEVEVLESLGKLVSGFQSLRSQISELSTKQKMHSRFTQANAVAAVERSRLPRLESNHVVDYRTVYRAQVFDHESF